VSKTGRFVSYSLMSTLLALTTALLLEGAFALPLIFAWLIGINLLTIIFFGIDKLNAEWADDIPERKAMNVRIPEWTLLLLALCGGSPMAMLSIIVFNHKTSDLWFIIRFVVILAVQGVLLYVFGDRIPWP
jgi:uncharacterized membrane protein YsdA (DUF1294 family)